MKVFTRDTTPPWCFSHFGGKNGLNSLELNNSVVGY